MDTKKLNQLKLTFGCILIGYSIFGMLLSFHYLFKLEIFSRDTNFLGWAIDNGGASNLPIFLGLTSCAGAFLIASIKSS